MTKKMDLCKPCAETLRKNSEIREIGRAIDEKVCCGLCGKRRFGGHYEVGKKAAK